MIGTLTQVNELLSEADISGDGLLAYEATSETLTSWGISRPIRDPQQPHPQGSQPDSTFIQRPVRKTPYPRPAEPLLYRQEFYKIMMFDKLLIAANEAEKHAED